MKVRSSCTPEIDLMLKAASAADGGGAFEWEFSRVQNSTIEAEHDLVDLADSSFRLENIDVTTGATAPTGSCSSRC